MADDKLRELERRWRESDGEADEERYLRERFRLGQLDTARLEIAAYAGHTAARAILGEDAPGLAEDRQHWSEGWSGWTQALIASQLDSGDGRIWFPGNPWPAGHRLQVVHWSGRVTETGLRVDLSVDSADYYEEDEDTDEDEDEDDSGGDWQAKIVWSNYHSCRIEGSFPIPRPEECFGALPLEFRVDADLAQEIDFQALAFSTYLLGHDSLADHRIRLSPHGDGTHRLLWDGAVALTYAGDDAFRHRFWIEVPRVTFEGFLIPKLHADSHKKRFAHLVSNPASYRIVHRDGDLWYVPAASRDLPRP